MAGWVDGACRGDHVAPLYPGLLASLGVFLAEPILSIIAIFCQALSQGQELAFFLISYWGSPVDLTEGLLQNPEQTMNV